MALGYPELTERLALYIAIKTLSEKHPKTSDIEPFDVNLPLTPIIPITTQIGAVNRKHKYTTTFSEKQQSLALYFLLEEIGITPRVDVNMTDVARFLHLLSNKPITRLDNSSKYSTLKKLYNGKSTPSILQDLETILPYFEKLKLEKAVKMIQEEIKDLKENMH